VICLERKQQQREKSGKRIIILWQILDPKAQIL